MSPYLIPLALLLLSRRLRSKGESPLLLSHYAQQDKKLALQAFMAGPMWIGWTRPKIVSIAKTLERVPILGLVGDLVEGYLPLVDDYFFCEFMNYKSPVKLADKLFQIPLPEKVREVHPIVVV